MKTWYLDFEEKHQLWHIDLKRVPENEYWTNICYGSNSALDHFCNIVDMMRREFDLTFTTEQIVRLAECTPGLTVHYPSSIPEDEFQRVRHITPIESKDKIDRHTDWQAIENERHM